MRGLTAILHVAATILACPPAGTSQPYQQEPVMEFDRTPSIIRETLSSQPFGQVDGFVQVPTAPGLGGKIDEDVL